MALYSKRRTLTLLAGAATLSLMAAACSSGSNSSSSDTSADNSRGPITYVQGKDNSDILAPTVAAWNKAHPNEKVTAKEQSDQADQQHDDLVQNFQAKSDAYDVVSVDVVWTAEFAAKGWLTPLKGDMALDTTGYLPATVKAATYNNTLFAAPVSSDGGILYYRKDLVPTPPTTIDDMWKDCAIAKKNNMDCYAGQFAKYEGLTVNATEWMNTFGGKVVDDSGKPVVDSPESLKGLTALVDGFKQGYIPKQALTYQEEQGRQSFEAGKLLFLRNWPYVYNLALTDASSKVKTKFAVAPLPGATAGNPGTSSLGGHSAAISAYSKHKATALDFLKFLTSEEQQKFNMEKGSLAPTRESLYSDASLVKTYPYLPTLLKSIQSAVPRPVTPFYPAVTTAIQDNSYAAISLATAPDQALKNMQAALTAAISGS
ncbi:Extracellular solute-binding protein family 1 [Nostocoides japonicum T1-X7]|uniref:Extracellular solute-binding protein family 1 n=1 Tax=Nostocoides japonicum T1-X7 TaxID=1194083 RepID=A0A077LTV5_9MICO|nr:ABC transporter substrate-binding protein [Tetrasphaera japonica]CCH77088.1 Extracellular solute-binding protein family 1 [Tetrasphaera japonica T1-X7]